MQQLSFAQPTTHSIVSANMSINSAEMMQLRILQRQYLQLVDPSQLRWPDAQVMKRLEVQSWMFLRMFDESNVKSPPPERYQLRVLKLLISKLERSIVDPEEDVRFPISSSHIFPRDFAISCALHSSSYCPNTILQLARQFKAFHVIFSC